MKGSTYRERSVPEFKGRKPGKLWCGKVQGLCRGGACTDCHMFPTEDIERDGLIGRSTLTDHERTGLTGKVEEE